MIKKENKIDNTLLLSVLAGTTLAVLLWICIVVNGIQTDLKEIHNTLDTMEETLEQDDVLLDKIDKQLKVICHMGQQQIECP